MELIVIAAVLLVVGGLYAVHMIRKNALEVKSSILREGDEMAQEESKLAKAGEAVKHGSLDADMAEELFAEIFSMRSAMSELVGEVRAMHETLSAMSVEAERERRVA